ncbi:MAG TPA: type II secretion system protein [Chthoniobacteraceae bacterium]|nr:type II secretion system protein [Chthoniobacteraceae bacterium]
MHHPPSHRIPDRAFTVSELLVTLVVGVILFSLVLASLNGLRREGEGSRCLANLRQLATALGLYAADHGGAYPHNRFNKSDPNRPGDPNDSDRPGPYWQAALAPYLSVNPNFNKLTAKTAGAFYCPADRLREENLPAMSYGFNHEIGLDETPLHRLLSAATRPGHSLWLLDMTRENGSFCNFTKKTWPFMGGEKSDNRVDFRHGNKAHGVFLDGSVRRFTETDLSHADAYDNLRLR